MVLPVILVSQRRWCVAFTDKRCVILSLLSFLFRSAAANWPSVNIMWTWQSWDSFPSIKTDFFSFIFFYFILILLYKRTTQGKKKKAYVPSYRASSMPEIITRMLLWFKPLKPRWLFQCVTGTWEYLGQRDFEPDLWSVVPTRSQSTRV